jgi:type I restriction enzyme R subunit
MGHKEESFESVIESYLLANGFVGVSRDDYDRERAIFPKQVLEFIQATQKKEWAKLEALHKDTTGAIVLQDLCKMVDALGCLTVLRHGFKCYGQQLHLAFFAGAHELNPELNERYQANCLGVTRQLHYSSRNENSLDLCLSLNGIPVISSELKNAMTGQTVDNAIRQYVIGGLERPEGTMCRGEGKCEAGAGRMAVSNF